MPHLAEDPATQHHELRAFPASGPALAIALPPSSVGTSFWWLSPSLYPSELLPLPVSSSQKHRGSGLGACLHSDPLPLACFVLSQGCSWLLLSGCVVEEWGAGAGRGVEQGSLLQEGFTP